MKAVERAADGQKYGKYLKWMENGTFDKWFALAIFFPAAPDDLLCFLAGVTSMSFKKVFNYHSSGKTAVNCGIFPGTAAAVYAGASTYQIGERERGCRYA